MSRQRIWRFGFYLAAAVALFALVRMVFYAGAASNSVTLSKNNEVFFNNLEKVQPFLSYIEADRTSGWYAEEITDKESLYRLSTRAVKKGGLIIPIFPTVYAQGPSYKGDQPYYNYILKESGIRRGDKVLVIGSGSGADAWAAFLMSHSVVYAVDINPLAVVNTRALAKLAGFDVRASVWDIRSKEVPSGLSDFDYVLWNMPFLANCGDVRYESLSFHDCDNGEVLEDFLVLLPKLLKKKGTAILLNTKEARERIKFPRMKVYKYIVDDGREGRPSMIEENVIVLQQ